MRWEWISKEAKEWNDATVNVRNNKLIEENI